MVTGSGPRLLISVDSYNFLVGPLHRVERVEELFGGLEREVALTLR